MNAELTQYIFIGAVAMTVMAVFVVLFLVYYQQKQLQMKVRLRELEEAYQKRLLDANLQGQELERRYIADGLHDNIGTMLSTVRFNLAQMGRFIPKNSIEQELLNQSKLLLSEAVENVRHLTKELKPFTLDNFGLISALDEYATQFSTEEISIQFNYEGQLERFDSSVELSVFRITQELVQNSLRHAHASEIQIQLLHEADSLLLTVSDNGVGFDLTEETRNGLGLSNIESRLNVIDGRVIYDVARGKGSYVIVEIKL